MLTNNEIAYFAEEFVEVSREKGVEVTMTSSSPNHQKLTLRFELTNSPTLK